MKDNLLSTMEELEKKKKHEGLTKGRKTKKGGSQKQTQEWRTE